MSGFRVSVRLAVLAAGLVIGLVTDLVTGQATALAADAARGKILFTENIRLLPMPRDAGAGLARHWAAARAQPDTVRGAVGIRPHDIAGNATVPRGCPAERGSRRHLRLPAVDQAGTRLQVDPDAEQLDPSRSRQGERDQLVRDPAAAGLEGAPGEIDDITDQNWLFNGDVFSKHRGKFLQLHLTIEDGGVFTTPWTATLTYCRDLLFCKKSSMLKTSINIITIAATSMFRALRSRTSEGEDWGGGDM